MNVSTTIAGPKILVFDVAPSRLMEMSVDYYRECQIAGAGSVEVHLSAPRPSSSRPPAICPPMPTLPRWSPTACSRCSARAPATPRSSCASFPPGRSTPCTTRAGE